MPYCVPIYSIRLSTTMAPEHMACTAAPCGGHGIGWLWAPPGQLAEAEDGPCCSDGAKGSPGATVRSAGGGYW